MSQEEKDKKEEKTIENDEKKIDSEEKQVEKAVTEETPPAAQAPVPEQAPAPALGLAAQTQAAPPPVAPAPVAQAPTPLPQAVPQAQPEMQAPSPMAPQQPQAWTPGGDAMQRTLEDYTFGDDLAKGVIQPKTYHQLYADKGLLGKIGTMFGLLVAGAGSGLTHQPNAVLEMMNKEIERDLESQKINQANKQSWFNMAMAHERNRAGIGLTEAQTAQGLAEASKAGSEARKAKYEADLMGADLSAESQSVNRALLGRDQYLQDYINKLPPGAQRAQAQAMMDNVIRPDTLRRVQMNNENASQKVAVVRALGNKPSAMKPVVIDSAEAVRNSPVFDQAKFDAAVQMGRINPKIPGAIPEHQVQTVNDAANAIRDNRNKLANYMDSFEALSTMARAGQAPGINVAGAALAAVPYAGAGMSHAADEAKKIFENERTRLVEPLKQVMGDKLAEALLPNWRDNPASMQEALRKAVQHFQTQESQYKQILKNYDLDFKFPEFNYKKLMAPAVQSHKTHEKATKEEQEQLINQGKALFGGS